MFEVRKIKGGWQVLEVSILDTLKEKDEATKVVEELESGKTKKQIIPFTSVTRQSGRYTTYVAIPANIAQKYSILPGDIVNLSLRLVAEDDPND